MKLIFVDAGTATSTTWTPARASSCGGCRRSAIACEHQEFDDGHRGTAYRYDVSLPKLAAAIGAAAG
jgi:enterochelin esterase family protein